MEQQLVINVNICGDGNVDTREAVVKALESVDLRAAVSARLLSNPSDYLPQQPGRRASVAPAQCGYPYHHHEAPAPNTYWQAPLPKATHRPRSRSSNDLAGLVIEIQKQDRDDDASTIATSATSAFRRSRSSNDLRSLTSLTMGKTPSRGNIKEEALANMNNPGPNSRFSRDNRSGTGRRSRSANSLRSISGRVPLTREQLQMHPSVTTRTSRTVPAEDTVPPPLMSAKRRGSTGTLQQSLVSDVTTPTTACRWNANSHMLPSQCCSSAEESDGGHGSGADSDSRVYKTAQGKRRRERTRQNRDAQGRPVRSRSANGLRRTVNSFPVHQSSKPDNWVPEVVAQAPQQQPVGRYSRSSALKESSDAGSVVSAGSASLIVPPNMPQRMGSLTETDVERVHERQKRRSRSRQRSLTRNLSANGSEAMQQETTKPAPQIRRTLSSGNSVVSELTTPPARPQRMPSRNEEDDRGMLLSKANNRKPQPIKSTIRRNRSASDLMSACSVPAHVGSNPEKQPVTQRRRKSFGEGDLQKQMMQRKRESLDSSYTDLFGGFRDRPSCKPSRRGSKDFQSTSGRTETTRSYYGDLFLAEEEEEEAHGPEHDEDHYSDSDDDSDSDSEEEDESESSSIEEAEELVAPPSVYPIKRASCESIGSVHSMAPWSCMCGEVNEADANFCGMCARYKKWTCTECYFANNKCRAIFCGGCAKQRSAMA
ncbi:expressed unknown protein [Seminavis robusta]|uniref:RanBP2-type domain-containing protein n=1 Tax=Seminavis robusta TaxID=568900 RepID=A0A9N8EAT8_9STRA|nr:expressed unknown protein [Seminavis robusta]|eukprot:Sro697_g189090.1 n/a (710) ;mRNA; f:34683-36812